MNEHYCMEQKKVFIVISKRTDMVGMTPHIEAWDDEEIAKIRVKRIQEAQRKEVDKFIFTSKNKRITQDARSIKWVNSDGIKREYVAYYVSVPFISTEMGFFDL